jgi:hypothetical protein
MNRTWNEGSELAFDLRLASAMRSSRQGAVLLIELAPRSPLELRWLKHELGQLEPRAMLHDAGESVLAIVAPELGANEAWLLMEHLKERAGRAHIHMLVGLASWPLQGSHTVEVVAAAAAALLDEHAQAQHVATDDEVCFEVDGFALAVGAAGELLTG